MIDHSIPGTAARCSLYRDLRPALSNPEGPEIVMVGMGNECEDSGWHVTGTCPGCGHKVSLVKSGCGRVECPRCFRNWARRAAERGAARVWGAMSAGVSRHVPRHFTFEVEDLDWGKAKAKALALGCTGGILVIHPWRIKKEYQEMFEIMAERGGVNRYDIVRESAYGMDALEWAPHCHCLGYGKLVEVTKDETDFLYRMIGPRYKMADVEGTLFYIFGHTFRPEKENGKSARYFGICSPSRLKPSWTGVCREFLRCPCCNEPVILDGGIEGIEITKYIALGWCSCKPGGRPPHREGAKHTPEDQRDCEMAMYDTRDSQSTPKTSASRRAVADSGCFSR